MQSVSALNSFICTTLLETEVEISLKDAFLDVFAAIGGAEGGWSAGMEKLGPKSDDAATNEAFLELGQTVIEALQPPDIILGQWRFAEIVSPGKSLLPLNTATSTEASDEIDVASDALPVFISGYPEHEQSPAPAFREVPDKLPRADIGTLSGQDDSFATGLVPIPAGPLAGPFPAESHQIESADFEAALPKTMPRGSTDIPQPTNWLKEDIHPADQPELPDEADFLKGIELRASRDLGKSGGAGFVAAEVGLNVLQTKETPLVSHGPGSGMSGLPGQVLSNSDRTSLGRYALEHERTITMQVNAAPDGPSSAIPDNTDPGVPSASHCRSEVFIQPSSGALPGILTPVLATSGVVTTAQLPRMVAQIIQTSGGKAGPVTEIALAPEELGRIRLSFRQHEADAARVVVMMVFDRPEAMDLFRKNADQLVADLRDAGYSGADLQFAQSGREDTSDDSTGTPEPGDPPHSQPVAQAPDAMLRLVIGASLDIRL